MGVILGTEYAPSSYDEQAGRLDGMTSCYLMGSVRKSVRKICRKIRRGNKKHQIDKIMHNTHVLCGNPKWGKTTREQILHCT